MSKRYLVLGIAAIIITLCIVGILEYNRQKSIQPVESMFADTNADSGLNNAESSKTFKPYKVKKEKHIDFEPQETKLDPNDPNYRFDVYDKKGYGKFVSVKEAEEKDNPYVQSVIEALNNKELYPERLSPAIRPKPFDSVRWANDPEFRRKYIQTHEPGRCYMSLKAGIDVQRIKRISPYMQMGGQSDIITLTVQTTPGAPITFTAFDGGQFLPSKLSSQTIASDAKTGVGTISYRAGPGVVEAVNILVASPLAAGTLKYKFDIRLDNDPELSQQ